MGILVAINTLITRINLITDNIKAIQTYLGVNSTGSTSSISERLAYVEGSCCSSSSTVSLMLLVLLVSLVEVKALVLDLK